MFSVVVERRVSSFWIHGYEMGTSPSLERNLSVWNYLDKEYTHFGYHFDEKDSILKIPFGITLDVIMSMLGEDDVVVSELKNNIEEYVESRHVNVITTDIKPRNTFQNDAVNFLIASSSSNEESRHRLVQLDTGFGKTACAIMAAMQLKVPTIVTSINLNQQWYDKLMEYTDGDAGHDIIFIKNRQAFEKLATSKKRHCTKATFYLVALDTLNASINVDETMLDRFNTKFGIGIHIFDEAHSHFLKILKTTVNSNVERTWFLTATPERGDKAVDKLYCRIFRDHIKAYGADTHDITKFNIIMLEYNTEPQYHDKWKVETRRGVSSTGHAGYLFKTSYRKWMIYNIVYGFVYKMLQANKFDPDVKCLVYIQGRDIIKWLVGKFNEKPEFKNGFKITAGDHTGNVTKGKDRDKELEKTIIFSTQSSREGFDIAGLKLCINFIPISSKHIVKQMRGRLRDEDGWYVDCTDIGFKGMIGQQRTRKALHTIAARVMIEYTYDKEERKIKRV